jgi:hypothetical protein
MPIKVIIYFTVKKYKKYEPGSALLRRSRSGNDESPIETSQKHA